MKRLCLTTSALGQVTVEYLLLAVVLYTLFHIMAGVTRQPGGALEKFSKMPSEGLGSATEYGVWKANPEPKDHPTHSSNYYTSEGLGP